MTDTPPKPPTPGTALSRAALERVLARAAQLQAASGDGDEGGAMSEEQLVELGKEVGLSGELLRQALAEERSRTLVPVESGMLASLAGAAAVTAARTLPGEPAAVLAALDGWMQRSEGLQVKRRFADQLVWEARRDFFSIFKRALTISGSGELASAGDVSAIVARVAPGKSHARVVADFSVERRERAGTGVALALALGALIFFPLLAINFPPILSALPAVLVPGFVLLFRRRQYQQLVVRAQIALEQALDRLEFVDQKSPTTAQVLLDAILGPQR